MSQGELLALIQKKDERAFTHLYDMYSKSLFSVINVLVKNREEAEDVLQDVFVKIWKTSIPTTKARSDSTPGSSILLEIPRLISLILNF